MVFQIFCGVIVYKKEELIEGDEEAFDEINIEKFYSKKIFYSIYNGIRIEGCWIPSDCWILSRCRRVSFWYWKYPGWCWTIPIYWLPLRPLFPLYINQISKLFECRYFCTVLKRFIKPWFHANFIYKWTPMYKNGQIHLANVQKLTNAVSD